MTQYTYHRSTDGCDDTFDIHDAQGDRLVSVHFWSDETGAEAKARLIVHRLNQHDRLLTALRAASDWIDARTFTPRTDIQAVMQQAIADATGEPFGFAVPAA